MKKKLNTHSSNTTSSVKKSSKSTGQRQKSTGTLNSLLPTPNACDVYTSELRSTQQKDHTKHSVKLGQIFSHPFYSQEASHASLSLKPEEEKERQTTATSGLQCLNASLFSDQSGSLLKMLAASLLGTKDWYSKQCALTWKTKVTKYNRLLFQLLPSARRTGGIESGLLPTATSGRADQERAPSQYKRNSLNLAQTIQMKGMLPTPHANLYKGTSQGSKPRDTVGSVIEQGAAKGQIGINTGMKLQPAFVEWMMGFPEGWTEVPDSKLLEMRSARRLQKKSLKESKPATLNSDTTKTLS